MRAIIIVAIVAFCFVVTVVMLAHPPKGGWCYGGKGLVPCHWVPKPLRLHAPK